MEQRTIHWLDLSEMKILKEIIIVADRQNGESEIGRIVYARPLTPEYNLKKQLEEDDKEADKELRPLFNYPHQRNYPHDSIDEMIIGAIRKTYPKSIVRNDTILFNVDLDKISFIKKRKAVPSTIYFSPEFSNIGNPFTYVGKTFKAPIININIYTYYNPASLNGEIFYANYNAAEETLLEQLNNIHFE
jgi:hypothetical protein